ncbi:unnamed protein product [Anisakis simplex]|uniref:Zinc finger protein n=1 Tax=Anisakis simplex TaxID=6269 RepID=A0A158PND7_ANISI|nr:unnamed protein product [Anisakis simplex]
MAVEDMNACAECGYTTNNFAEFTEHIEQHESEQLCLLQQQQQQQQQQQLQQDDSIIRSDHQTSNQQEWSCEDVADESATTISSPEQSPLITYGVLSRSLSPLSAVSNPTTTATSKRITNSTSATATALTTNNHNGSNSNKTVHSCPHCNFTTFMSQHMKSHLEAHERHQGQMYQCDICHMQFSQKANMHRHRMRHSGVKPYQCRYCLKKFFRKDQMQEHSMTHIKTGADFDCPVSMCDQQFSQHSGLRNHLDEMHTISPSSPASCKRCSLLFSNSRRLLLHYQTKHDEGDTSGIVVMPSGEVLGTNTSLSSSSLFRTASDSTSSTGSMPTASSVANAPPVAKKRRSSTFASSSLPTQTINSSCSSSSSSSSTSSTSSTNANENKSNENSDNNKNGNPLMNPPTAIDTSSLSISQNISAAIRHQLKLIQQQDYSLNALEKKLAYCQDYEQNPYTVTNEELLMSLSNAATLPSMFSDAKAEAAMQLWTREGNSASSSDNTEEQSHSPSVDSSSSAVDGEIGDKEQQVIFQECMHCGMIFLDQTLYLLHKGLHSDSDPWKCNLCGHPCGDKYMFTTHVISSDHSC